MIPETIISIEGGICSGKSWLIGQLQRTFANTAAWDVSAFYEKQGCYRLGRMDWRTWRRVAPRAVEYCKLAMMAHPHCNAFMLEWSGTNEAIYEYIRSLPLVWRFYLQAPSYPVLKERAHTHRLSMDEILVYNDRNESSPLGGALIYSPAAALLEASTIVRNAMRLRRRHRAS